MTQLHQQKIAAKSYFLIDLIAWTCQTISLDYARIHNAFVTAFSIVYSNPKCYFHGWSRRQQQCALIHLARWLLSSKMPSCYRTLLAQRALPGSCCSRPFQDCAETPPHLDRDTFLHGPTEVTLISERSISFSLTSASCPRWTTFSLVRRRTSATSTAPMFLSCHDGDTSGQNKPRKKVYFNYGCQWKLKKRLAL